MIQNLEVTVKSVLGQNYLWHVRRVIAVLNLLHSGGLGHHPIICNKQKKNWKYLSTSC